MTGSSQPDCGAVPQFQQYFPSEAEMNESQRAFYGRWVSAWNNGEAVPVDGNISYLFCYTYSVLGKPPKAAACELKRLIKAYVMEAKFAEYCRIWLSDCYAILGEYRQAVIVYPPIPITSRSGVQTDDILSLKIQTGDRLSGRDAMTLDGPNVTTWGRKHVDEIAQWLDVLMSAYESNNGVNLIQMWSGKCREDKYQVFRGSVHSTTLDIPWYSFSTETGVLQFVRDLTREAENTVREERSLPHVGEGWVSETALYYEIKMALSGTTVIHHARPDWLGEQHLDIYLPDYAVGIEFQGLQHDQPVDYFGGRRAYEATKRRDTRKKRLCTRNGVELLYVRPCYVLEGVVAAIREGQKRHPISQSG